MQDTFRYWLSLPNINNEQLKNRALILRIVIFSGFVNSIGFILLSPYAIDKLVGMVTILLQFGALRLLQKGYIVTTARAVVGLSWLTITIMMFGSPDVVNVVWPLLIVVLAGVVLSPWCLLFVMVLTLISTAWVTWHHFGAVDGEMLAAVLVVSAALFMIQFQNQRLLTALNRSKKRFQKQLKERRLADDRYYTVLDAIPVGTYIVDLGTYKIVYANDAIQEFMAALNFNMETDTLNDLIQNHLEPEMRKRFHERFRYLQNAVDGTPPPPIEYNFKTLDGSKRYVQLNSRTINHEGRPSVLVILTDITAVHQAQEQLAIQEKEYRDLVQTQTDPVCRFDPHTWTMTFVNQAYLNYFNVYQDDVIGNPFVGLIVEEYQPVVREAIQQILQTGQSQTIEQISRKPNGEERWQQWTNVPILDENDNVVSIQAVGRDIHALKKAEDALRQSEKNYRSILEQVPVGVVVHSMETLDIFYANTIWRDMIGGDDFDPYAGMIPIDCIPDEEYDRYTDYISRLLEEGKLTNARMNVQRLDGALVSVDINAVVTPYNNQQAIIALIKDLTEAEKAVELRKQLENEQQLGHMRQEFMSMMSHEFRTPLTVIRSSADLLNMYRDKMTQERLHHHIDKIYRQIRLILRLLDDIMLLNKAKVGMLEFNPSRQNIIVIFQELIEEIAVTFEVNHPLNVYMPQEEIIMPVDERLMRHIITNLISNAAKYSPPDAPIMVMVSKQPFEIMLTIRDEGMGIPEEHRANLFSPFARAENVKNIEGTGLGLAIVKASVEMHGGEISFESIEGEGTTFIITLPLY